MGTFAYVEELQRSKVGVFDIKDSIDSKDIEKLGRDYLLNKLYPTDYPLTSYPSLNLDKTYMKQAINGMTMLVDQVPPTNPVKVYCDGVFIGLARSFKKADTNLLKMEKVFYDE